MKVLIGTNDSFTLSRALLAARDKAGLTQTQVADSMNVFQSYVSTIEQLRNDDLRIGVVRKYLEACGQRLTITVSR